ncbi:hypothetical protein REPUB_Repub16aG0046800 [Reevesia pubescens]
MVVPTSKSCGFPRKPALKFLIYDRVDWIGEEMLHEIALTCANLHVLNSSYCPNTSLESVRLPMLVVLKHDNCEGITSASMAAIAYSSMLAELELDNCHMLTSVSLDLPRLQEIRLKQKKLTILALQCECLQEVDFTDCASLTNSIFSVFSNSGGCPRLKSLVMDNCERLTAVLLSSTSLVSVSLGCCQCWDTDDSFYQFPLSLYKPRAKSLEDYAKNPKIINMEKEARIKDVVISFDPSFISFNQYASGMLDLSLKFLPEPINIRISCIGQLCFQSIGDNVYYICILVTKEWKWLPDPSLYYGTEAAFVLVLTATTQF